MKPSKHLGIYALILILSLGIQLLHLNSHFWGADHLQPIDELLEGKTMYKQITNQHAPGPYHFYAFFLRIIGKSLTNLVIVNIAVNSFISIMLYHISKKLILEKHARVLAILYIMIGIPLWILSINVDVTFNLICTIATLFFLQYIQKNQTKYLVLSGIFFGSSVLFKQNVGIYAIMATALYLIATKSSTPLKKLVYKLIIFTASTAPLPLLTVLYFFLKDSLREFYTLSFLWIVKYNAGYNAPIHPLSLLFVMLQVFALGIYFGCKKHGEKRIFYLSLVGLFLSLGLYPMYGEVRLIPLLGPFLIVGFWLFNYSRTKKVLDKFKTSKYLKFAAIILLMLNLPILLFNSALVAYHNLELRGTIGRYHFNPELVEYLSNTDDVIYFYPFDDKGNFLEWTTGCTTMNYSFYFPHLLDPAEQDKVIHHLRASQAKILYLVEQFPVVPERDELVELNNYISHNYEIVRTYKDNLIVVEHPMLAWVNSTFPFLYPYAPDYFDSNIYSESTFIYELLTPNKKDIHLRIRQQE